MTRHPRSLALMLALAGLAACERKDRTEAADSAATASSAAAPQGAIPGANAVTITAADFKFTGPTEIPSGLTTIRLVNQGPDIHHAQIVKLDSGKTGADFAASIRSRTPHPWARATGGPNAPAPGKESNATSVLEPGNYALVCFVDTPDRVPHLLKGMVHDFQVVASGRPVAAEPAAQATIRMLDFAFQFPDSMAAGTHLFRVENGGTADHEVEIFKLAPGKTLRDLQGWMHTMAGPPPAEPIGGVVGITATTHAFFSANLDAGDYVLYCFVFDPKSGKPHFDLGMMKPFKVS